MCIFFFQAEDGIRDHCVTGVQTCALPILQLTADSFLDQLGKRCEGAGVRLTRQLLEGINYEEIVNEVNRGEGRLPGLIGFDPDRAAGYDGGDKVRADVKVGENGRLVAEDE